MIVIAAQTEHKLQEDLRRYGAAHGEQRCFLLKFSQTDVCKDRLFERCLGLLDQIPSYYLARVYLFADKDIAIMMEGFMQRQFLKFCEGLTCAIQRSDFLNIIDIYDLDTHMEELHDICTQKIAHGAAQEDGALAGIAPNEDYKKRVLHSLNHEDIATLHQRREERVYPLVMIADDDQLCRTLASNALHSEYDLTLAKNGEDALREYVSAVPDILFLDIGMPDINGHDVLELLFQIDPEAHVIMFSGQKDKATIVKSLQLGAQGFLAKPYTRKQLYSHVENAPFVQIKRALKKSGVA